MCVPACYFLTLTCPASPCSPLQSNASQAATIAPITNTTLARRRRSLLQTSGSTDVTGQLTQVGGPRGSGYGVQSFVMAGFRVQGWT